MNALVGYTGFVGSNLYETGVFDKVYNSKNIDTAIGLAPDLLVYAGIRAEKYLANNFPEKDMELILQAQSIIRSISPKKLVLISTIDVLDTPINVDEDASINYKQLHPYGLNRYKLEEWVFRHYPDALIIRLPALFGKNIKKNFLYDFINVIPYMLKSDKFMNLVQKEPILKNYYQPLDNGYFVCRNLSDSEKSDAKKIFRELGFTALNFTDSRSVFQFYCLSNLWSDMQIALTHDLHLWHPATEPVSVAEIYKYVTGETFFNELNSSPAFYNYKTKHAEIFGGRNGYICDKHVILEQIAQFIRIETKHHISQGEQNENINF